MEAETLTTRSILAGLVSNELPKNGQNMRNQNNEKTGAEVRPKVLIIYNGSTKGHLSGGEYAHKNIRETLKESFSVRELLLDNWVTRFKRSRLKPVMKAIGLPVSVIASYFLYRRFDLVITSWTPKLPFYGDLSYLQPFADVENVFGNPDSDASGINILGDNLWYLPNRILTGPSLRRHYFGVNSKFANQKLKEQYQIDSVVIYPPAPSGPADNSYEKEDLVLSLGRIVPSKG